MPRHEYRHIAFPRLREEGHPLCGHPLRCIRLPLSEEVLHFGLDDVEDRGRDDPPERHERDEVRVGLADDEMVYVEHL